MCLLRNDVLVKGREKKKNVDVGVDQHDSGRILVVSTDILCDKKGASEGKN